MNRLAGDTPMDLSPQRFEQRLAALRVEDPRTTDRRSAVAALLRFDRGVPDVLLMKRVERTDDRWSGHISLPGGRESPTDEDLLATAMRETREEVGVDLRAGARLIGRLEPLRAVAEGRVQPMVIAPFVFVQTGPVTIELGHEAQEAFWLPLDRAVSGELADEYPYVLGAETRILPSWRYEGHVIWGLTYRMLDDLLGLVARD
jgi:8-oxo-dGTP pyrophosphatase MutT (NUDIX family)